MRTPDRVGILIQRVHEKISLFVINYPPDTEQTLRLSVIHTKHTKHKKYTIKKLP